MVMPAASTGSASSSRNAVTSTDQTNSGILWSVMPGARMLKMVVMKLIAPRIDEAPARCSEKMTRSTDGRSEEHTSELKSLMRISYAVFCLKKKKETTQDRSETTHRQ